ncbi:hypothetical protein Salat_0656500 [Sesamum alatum]|uniref:Uncharacterized protein n=1 Tax=Sesamum alatum TaxID=300844 RepID=A0AAE1YRB2_9LAMI|nr:hypothetical protein Salat_0656500 [Sesamum alatum]
MSGASTSRAQHDAQHGARQPQQKLPYMDLDDRNRYEGLRSCTITNTDYIDNEVLNVLGISDDVEGRITFRFRHIECRVTLAQFNAIFGLPLGEERWETPAFRPDKFWYDLTRQASYDATRSKSFAIINPYFRYLHHGYEEAQGRIGVDLATCQAMKMITRMGDQYHLLMPDPLPSIPLPDPARLTIQIQENWWLQAPSTNAEPKTVQLHLHLPPLMQSGRPVDLSPMPQLPTPYKGSSTRINNSSTGKRSSVINKHSSKTPSTTWPTSSNACMIGS